MKVEVKRIINMIIKISGLLITAAGIFILIYIASSRLIMDKKAKYAIDEGQYILNRMAEEYEKFLREKQITLTSEREKLITLEVQARSEEERRRIRERLNQIENEKNLLNNEYVKNVSERKQMEANLASMKQTLSSSVDEISRLNKKYNDLVLEKNSIELYWNNYINDLKRMFKEKYKFDLAKTAEIDKSFANDNGKDFITSEFREFYAIAKQKDERLDLLTKQKDDVIKQRDYTIKEKLVNISSLQEQLDRKIAENEKLQKIIKTSQLDKDFYIKFYNDYSDIITNFEKMMASFNNAEKMYKSRDYKNALPEYEKVLNAFNEINISYKKVRELTDKVNEDKAGDIYFQASQYIKNGDNEKAYDAFSRLVKNYPGSKYTEDSLNQLLKISNSFSDKEKTNIANKNASELFQKAQVLNLSKNYEEADDVNYKIIEDYPNSDYAAKAIKQIKENYKVMLGKNREQYDKELADKFKIDYDAFKQYYKKGNLEKARFYYFTALKNAFDIYSSNSIEEFKEFEDQYIEMLVRAFEQNLKIKYKIKDTQE